MQLTSESSPPKRPQSPTAADDALLVECLKKPAKRWCKALRLAQPLRRTRTATEKLACLQYADTQLSQRAAAKAKPLSDWQKIRPQLEALVKRGSRKQQFSGVLVFQVVPVEHVQLFKVESSCQKKWHTERVSQWSYSQTCCYGGSQACSRRAHSCDPC